MTADTGAAPISVQSSPIDHRHRSLPEQLQLTQIGPDTYQGWCHDGDPGRIFGGHLIAQAILAAGRSVEAGRPIHSAHSYFMRAGNPSTPVTYRVEQLRDGGSYSLRRVVAEQNEIPILILSASFHRDEPGSTRQVTMPEMPAPETLPDLRAQLPHGAVLSRTPMMHTAEIKFCGSGIPAAPQDANDAFWVRIRGQMPADPNVHRAAVAYLSDLNLARVPQYPHRRDGREFVVASLDHAVWLHRTCQADEWMLYVQDSPNADGGRGLARGHLFTRDGILVATSTQETVLRSPR